MAEWVKDALCFHIYFIFHMGVVKKELIVWVTGEGVGILKNACKGIWQDVQRSGLKVNVDKSYKMTVVDNENNECNHAE